MAPRIARCLLRRADYGAVGCEDDCGFGVAGRGLVVSFESVVAVVHSNRYLTPLSPSNSSFGGSLDFKPSNIFDINLGDGLWVKFGEVLYLPANRGSC